MVLAGCQAKEDNTSEEASKEDTNKIDTQDKTGKDEVSPFQEEEAIELDGPVTTLNFSLDEDGDTLFWGENDGGRGDDLRRNVWVDGEVKSLDHQLYDQFSMLSQSGHIITSNQVDTEEGVRHAIIEYDPRTDQTKEFVAEDDRVDMLHFNRGAYIQDPRTYIHTETKVKEDNADTFLWKVDEKEYMDLNIIKGIKSESGQEIKNYPHYYVTKDISTVYAVVLDGGIFAYDIASGEIESLLETDNLVQINRMLTYDEKYIVYGVHDPEAELSVTIQAFNLETKETIELGEGTKVFPLTNGNVAIIDQNEVKQFDFPSEKLETMNKIELKENEDIDNITVSTDGSTIAYGITQKGAEDTEDTSQLVLLKQK